MKILFPVEVFFPSQAGGPANTVYWLAKNLVLHGYEPVVVASDKGLSKGSELNQWNENEAGRVIFIRTRFLHFPLGQTLVSLAELRRADLVHLSSVFYPAAFLTAFAARILGKRIIWSPRGELSGYSLNYSGRRKAPILWLIRRVIGCYPVFHSTSDDETRCIKDLFGKNAKVFQIPNYVELPPQVARKPERYLLFIGRLHPKKAIDDLIRAAATSEAFRSSDFVLKIAGTGKPEYLDVLKALTTELEMDSRVEFVGQVEGEAKSQLLANAYFIFMPSHTENFGIVVLESLAQGTPVVASVHTPWEILEKEGVGIWAENTPSELSEVINRIVRMNDAEYSAYRAKGRDLVEREFDISSHMGGWLELYGHAIRRGQE